MIITYYGKQFIKVQQGDTVLAYNPIASNAKVDFKVSRFGSDVVLSAVNHSDANGFDTVTYGDKNPVVISGPGDYETKEIFIKGNLTRVIKDGKPYINTVYAVNLEEVNLLFLGYLDHVLDTKEREGLKSPDILFVPVGKETLSASDAYKLAVSFEPSIIIPLGEEDAVALFLKEAGAKDTVPTDKLVLKRKDLMGKVGEVAVLTM